MLTEELRHGPEAVAEKRRGPFGQRVGRQLAVLEAATLSRHLPEHVHHPAERIGLARKRLEEARPVALPARRHPEGQVREDQGGVAVRIEGPEHDALAEPRAAQDRGDEPVGGALPDVVDADVELVLATVHAAAKRLGVAAGDAVGFEDEGAAAGNTVRIDFRRLDAMLEVLGEGLIQHSSLVELYRRLARKVGACPELEELEPEPAQVQPAQPVATVTLGELYLRQGHADEAERIFREVLEREPGNGAAVAGLERVEEARLMPAPAPQARPLDAERLLEGFSGVGTTARKVFLLSRYLERIRGSRLRRENHVP